MRVKDDSGGEIERRDIEMRVMRCFAGEKMIAERRRDRKERYRDAGEEK